MELVDPRLGSKFNKEEAMRMIRIALLCANPSPVLRPSMSNVVSMLKGDISVKKLDASAGNYVDDFFKFQAIRDQEYERQMSNFTGESESTTPILSFDEINMASSSSISARM